MIDAMEMARFSNLRPDGYMMTFEGARVVKLDVGLLPTGLLAY